VIDEASEPLTAQVDITLRPTGDRVVAEVSVLYPSGSGPPICRSQSFAFARPSTDTNPSEE
jgi:hypothetical protein